MLQTPEPAGRRPRRDREIPGKFEKIFSYCVVSIVVLLGVLVLMGAFGISSQFKGIIGVMLIGYGLIRFLMMKARFQRHNEKKEGRMGEGDKERGEILRR
jgi:multisubunit Na+/H+ antiporter MnhC subunit